MALIKCKECGSEVSSKAEACPKCGYKVASNQWTTFRKIKYGLVLILIILLNQTCHKEEIPKAPVAPSPLPPPTDVAGESSSNSPTSITIPSPSPNSQPVSQWSYDQQDDGMGKGTAYFALVSSSNTVNFSFPYSGEQHASLLIRNHPRHGKDIIFKIEKGQILCNSYDGCNVLVRFDGEDSKNYSASGSADNSTETIFISNYDGFISKLQKAKKLKLAVNIYQQGAPVFEFDISGFDVNKYKPKNKK